MQTARSPRALFNARLDIQNRSVISELRPFKDDAFSEKSMDFDRFGSILEGFLLKSVHALTKYQKIGAKDECVALTKSL